MNPEAQEYFDKLLKKSLSELTENEKEFLIARRGYLKESQLVEYKDILEHKQVVETASEGVSYNDLFKQAKELGYKGGRISRNKLEEFIKTNQ